MTARSFVEFCDEISTLVKSTGSNAQIKIETDIDSEIIKIVGGRFSQLARAKSGLADLSELPMSTAEHHPYWNLISQCCQICSTVLERWDSELTPKDIEEMQWHVDQLSHTCRKISGRLQ